MTQNVAATGGDVHALADGAMGRQMRIDARNAQVFAPSKPSMMRGGGGREGVSPRGSLGDLRHSGAAGHAFTVLTTKSRDPSSNFMDTQLIR